MNYVLEPHFLGIMLANQMMAALSRRLPQTDIVVELQEHIKIQLELAIHMINDTKFGAKKLKQYIERTEEMLEALAIEEAARDGLPKKE